jgi:hypothetical protein
MYEHRLERSRIKGVDDELLLLVLRRVISLFDCVLLAQVLPVLGHTVPPRALLVANMGLSVDPNLARPTTGSLGW